MIKMKLIRTNVYTRWPCTVCGGHTEKVSTLCEATDSINGGEDLRVCERCLKAGQAGIDHRLMEHAEDLERLAKQLRNLAGQLKVPTFEEWRAAEAAAEAEDDEARAAMCVSTVGQVN